MSRAPASKPKPPRCTTHMDDEPEWAGLCGGGGGGTRFLAPATTAPRVYHHGRGVAEAWGSLCGSNGSSGTRFETQDGRGAADLGLRVLRRPDLETRSEARARNGGSTDAPVDILGQQRRCARVRLAGGGAVAAKPPGARSRSLAGPGVELAARRRELRAASKAKTKSAGGDRCC